MTPPAPTMTLRDVHVAYRVYEDRQAGLKELVAQGRISREHRRIHAVKGVSLDVFEGETLGIVGGNGSGKSTLLAAMTGLLPLESGSIAVRSRPRLLGVSAVLRPSLSGRRNIVIGGLALGLRLSEVERRMDDIVEFAGLTDAIDLPMRTYSSGMRARLNFAIATSTVPDILLIDEALAVGDEEFRTRSEERIDEIRARAGSVVLVSHNLREIEQSCDRAVWLDHGVLRREGDPSEVVEAYLADESGDSTAAPVGIRPHDRGSVAATSSVAAPTMDASLGPRRAVVHIGASLTSTVAIQEDLWSRRNQLRAAGLDYPSFLGQRNHSKLAAYASDDAAAMLGLTDPDARAEWRERFAGDFVSSSRDLSGLVVSSQHLCSYVFGDDIATLMELLSDAGFDTIDVVMMVPRQDVLAASTYLTMLRDGDDQPFDLQWHLDARWRYDFEAIAADWESSHPAARVAVRLHPTGPGADPLGVFGAAAALPVAEEREELPSSEIALDPKAVHFLRDLNGVLGRNGDGGDDVHDPSWLLARFGQQARFGLADDDARRLLAEYAASNRALLARVPRELCDPDYFAPRDLGAALEADYDADEALGFAAELWRSHSLVTRRWRRAEEQIATSN
ncbi:MAG: ABC transporter ATP-binding protein [Actinomycetota bacterium]